MKTRLALFCLICLITAGCLDLEKLVYNIPVSLYPLYTEDNIIFEESLLGTWGEEKPGFIITEGPGETSYFWEIADSNDRMTFRAYLLKLDETLFLDLACYPQDVNNFLVITGHLFIKVECIEPELAFRLVDMTKIDPNQVDHETVQERTIFTASSRELQSYIQQNLNNSEFFGDLQVFKKLKDGKRTKTYKPKPKIHVKSNETDANISKESESK
jgi:hypothetical protein